MSNIDQGVSNDEGVSILHHSIFDIRRATFTFAAVVPVVLVLSSWLGVVG